MEMQIKAKTNEQLVLVFYEASKLKKKNNENLVLVLCAN